MKRVLDKRRWGSVFRRSDLRSKEDDGIGVKETLRNVERKSETYI